FFFPSRRRHTRSYGDWSSDVCSSDLDAEDGNINPADVSWSVIGPETRAGTGGRATLRGLAPGNYALSLDARDSEGNTGSATAQRSEERRVGKECRSGWGRWDVKNKDS